MRANPTLLATWTAVKGSGSMNSRNGDRNPKNAKLRSAMRSYAIVPATAAATSDHFDFEALPNAPPISAAAPVPRTWNTVHGPWPPQTRKLEA